MTSCQNERVHRSPEQSEPLGARLRGFRRRHGLTQGQLAVRLGLTRQAISKWETGQSAPDLENIRRLAQLYDCSVDNLLGEGEKESRGERKRTENAVSCTRSELKRIQHDRALVWKHALISGALMGIGFVTTNELYGPQDQQTTPLLLLINTGIALACVTKLITYVLDYRQRGGSRLIWIPHCAFVASSWVVPLCAGGSSAAIVACFLGGVTSILCANRIIAWRLLYQRSWNPREDLSDPFGRRSHTS